MKGKLALALVVGIVVFGMVGCKKEEKSSSSSTSVTKEAPKNASESQKPQDTSATTAIEKTTDVTAPKEEVKKEATLLKAEAPKDVLKNMGRSMLEGNKDAFIACFDATEDQKKFPGRNVRNDVHYNEI